MTSRARLVVLCLLAATAVGCPPMGASSKRYQPEAGRETELFATATPRVLPDDVRADLDAHRQTVVRWSGVILECGFVPEQNGLRLLVEHHYWDWIEDYSIQREIAFLSPRGEGRFVAWFEGVGRTPSSQCKVEDMAIVYGKPDGVMPDGRVVLRGGLVRTLRRDLYATDVWDYGRAFVLNGDAKDMKVLRIPR
jgi:hypothetical protein